MSDSLFEVLFHNEDVEFSLPEPEETQAWILSIINVEEQNPGNINFIFCSDEYLYKMNKSYLDHDTYTDVITFPLRKDRIEGDIFISITRVTENSVSYNVPFEKEIKRVMVHGVLHLLGYNDKSPEEKDIMTKKEDFYLAKLYS